MKLAYWYTTLFQGTRENLGKERPSVTKDYFDSGIKIDSQRDQNI
jgi:hypothetical protein